MTSCGLCQRRIDEERLSDPQAVQEHHLWPERRAESPTVDLCRPCHKQVHALFTNEELRGTYDTIERLRDADRLTEYIEWIRGTNKLDIEVVTSNHVTGRG